MSGELLNSLFGGYNTTLLLGGQAGSGKTHTAIGVPDDPGIICALVHGIFDEIAHFHEDKEFLVRVSYLDIHQDNARDLLVLPGNDDTDGRRTSNSFVEGIPHCRVRGSQKKMSWVVEGLTEKIVTTADEFLGLLEMAEQQRNNLSQSDGDVDDEQDVRSHTILRIMIESRGVDAPHECQLACLSVVDTTSSSSNHAGNDQVINQSLDTLSKIVTSLSAKRVKRSSLPFAETTLTKLLAPSLGGNAKTMMILCISPDKTFTDKALQTLTFASHTMKIENVLTKVPVKHSTLSALHTDIAFLSSQINSESPNQGITGVFDEQQSRQRLGELKNMIIPGGTVAISSIKKRVSIKDRTKFFQENPQKVSAASLISIERMAIIRGLIVPMTESKDPGLTPWDSENPDMSRSNTKDEDRDAVIVCKAGSLFDQFNDVADTFHGTLQGLRSVRRSSLDASEIAQQLDEGALWKNTRWVKVDALDNLESRFSQHLIELHEANKKLQGVVDDMRMITEKASLAAHPTMMQAPDQVGNSGVERLQAFIKMSNQTTGHSDLSRQELIGQMMAERQELEITRALYLNSMFGMISSNEHTKNELLKAKMKESQRAQKAEDQLRRTEHETMSSTLKHVDVVEESNARDEKLFVHKRWKELS